MLYLQEYIDLKERYRGVAFAKTVKPFGGLSETEHLTIDQLVTKHPWVLNLLPSPDEHFELVWETDRLTTTIIAEHSKNGK